MDYIAYYPPTHREDFIPAVTALKYKDALNLAVGTATGQVLRMICK